MNILKRLAVLAGTAAAVTVASAGAASADPVIHDHGGLIGDIVVVAPITDVLNNNNILNNVLNGNVLALLGGVIAVDGDDA